MQLCVEYLNRMDPLPIDLKQAEISLPYFSSSAIIGLGSYLGGDACVATARNDHGTLMAVAIYFVVKSDALSVGVSRGRHGFFGIQVLNGLNAAGLSSFVEKIKDKSKHDGLASLSLCLDGISGQSFDVSDLPSCDLIDTGFIFLCDLSTIFNQHGDFIFHKYTTSSGLSQPLRQGREKGYYGELSKSMNTLKDWHKHCHVQRGQEQNGQGWPWSFVEMLVSNTQWLFYSVKDISGNVVGGSLAIFSRDVIEIIAISTPREHMQHGANYILTEFIYKDAFARKVKYINWQASNPPTGGVADYKMKWGAKRVPVHTLNYILDDKSISALSADILSNMFGEHYVIPYRWFDDR